MLVQPRHRVALLGLGVVRRGVHAAEVHLRASLADRQLDRPPAQQVHDPGVRFADTRRIGRVDGRESIAVAIQDQPAERSVGRRGVEGLEVDEQAGRDAPRSTSR